MPRKVKKSFLRVNGLTLFFYSERKSDDDGYFSCRESRDSDAGPSQLERDHAYLVVDAIAPQGSHLLSHTSATFDAYEQPGLILRTS